MAADTNGNDITQVVVPVTGFAAINFSATSVPTISSGNALPTGYTYLGLFTEDGGPGEEIEAGDEILFYQQGYSLQGGTQSISKTWTFAEMNDNVLKLMGYSGTIGTSAFRSAPMYQGTVGLIWAETSRDYSNPDQTNTSTYAALAQVTDVSVSQSTRGEVDSVEITFKMVWTQEHGYYVGPVNSTHEYTRSNK